ncbi:acyl--CoA ligase [Nonomuraea sp. NN258]|uniref:AMP-binding protein n=1 Tax=Nonomuraea antri TaxID=2730852 RepID=UPI001568057E|nr:AMP-binding protein [Nonomuraea antri]NRQ37773.1 acyl--CoA ligase [Nonomuraea antri]
MPALEETQVRAFRTSGTTGEPVTWLRDTGQLRAEAAILAELCSAGQADGIVCYAPPDHLYGYLMGLALPELTGLPCRILSVTAPLSSGFAGFRRPVVAALPAAVVTMARDLPTLRRLDRLTLVHGSAALTPAAVDLLAALDGRAELVELFGSTETGLVGRRSRHTDDWRPAPDVTLATEPDGRLRVTSPRIARRDGEPAGPAGMRDTVLDDLVTVNPDQTFRWLGRANRLIKINGRRVHLDQVESALRDLVPGATLWCRAEPDAVRGEWFSVLVTESDRVEAVRTACRTLPAAARPRTVAAA